MSETPTAPPGTQPAGSKTLQLLDALRGIMLPGQSSDIVAQGLVKNVSISEGVVKFNLQIDDPSPEIEQFLEQGVERQLAHLPWVTEVEMGYIGPPEYRDTMPPPGAPAERPATLGDGEGHRPIGGLRAAAGPIMPDVKNVIAIGSGKGGVGKSTVSVNLALALAALGHKVGLLDGDVYGPSVPLMLGLTEQPLVNEQEKLVPPQIHGLKVISMGLLLKPEQAVVWRGPMVHGVMKQFLGDVDWGELDFLIIDLPPGTGDAPLSMSQAVPLTAAVVVTTPQEVAASVAGKAIAMFERMGIRMLGVIENMSYFVCPSCHFESHIFDRGGGHELARHHDIPFLGEIPLDIRMRQGGDIGQPVMLQFPGSDLAKRFTETARALARVCAERSL